MGQTVCGLMGFVPVTYRKLVFLRGLWIPDQLGPHSETVSQQKQERNGKNSLARHSIETTVSIVVIKTRLPEAVWGRKGFISFWRL